MDYDHHPYDPLDATDTSSLKCFSSALENIHFHFNFPFDRNTYFVILSSHLLFALGVDAIAPLLSLSRLTDLDLDWICASNVGDAALKTMV